MPTFLPLLDLGVLTLGGVAFLVAAFASRGAITRGGGRAEYYVASRRLPAFVLGAGMAAVTLGLAAPGLRPSLALTPGAAYEVGLQALLLLAALWLAAPWAAGWWATLHRRLGAVTSHEYLHSRFGGAARVLAALLFVAWRLVWLAASLAFAAAALRAAGCEWPTGALAALLGGAATLLACASGLRGLALCEFLAALLLLAVMAIVIVAIWLALPEGPPQVWETTVELHRHASWPLSWRAEAAWPTYLALPALVVILLATLAVDQTLVQRQAAAVDVASASRAVAWSVGWLSLALGLAVYAGLALLAYYHQFPQSMRPLWVANVHGADRQSLTKVETRRPLLDPLTGRPLTSLLSDKPRLDPTSGEPLLDWTRDELSPDTLPTLLAEGRLLQPNRETPFAPGDADRLLTDTAPPEIRVAALAQRRPAKGQSKTLEIVTHRRSTAELWPWFVRRLPAGLWSVAVLACAAAALVALAAQLHATATVLTHDLPLARPPHDRHSKEPADARQPSQAGDVDPPARLARGAALALGTLVTLAAAGCALTGDPIAGRFGAGWWFQLAGVTAGPLLGVFLLGLCSLRGTSVGAVGGLALGAAAGWGGFVAGGVLWPRGDVLALEAAALLAGCLTAWLGGYALSAIASRPIPKTALRGLTIWHGELGERTITHRRVEGLE